MCDMEGYSRYFWAGFQSVTKETETYLPHTMYVIFPCTRRMVIRFPKVVEL